MTLHQGHTGVITEQGENSIVVPEIAQVLYQSLYLKFFLKLPENTIDCPIKFWIRYCTEGGKIWNTAV